MHLGQTVDHTKASLPQNKQFYFDERVEIVHNAAVANGGAPNKNIGDAFLIVWKLDPKQNVADNAFLYVPHNEHCIQKRIRPCRSYADAPSGVYSDSGLTRLLHEMALCVITITPPKKLGTNCYNRTFRDIRTSMKKSEDLQRLLKRCIYNNTCYGRNNDDVTKILIWACFLLRIE